MELVKYICDVTGAKIVITSSWRRNTLEHTLYSITTVEELQGHEPFLMPEYVIGLIPRMFGVKLGSEESTHYEMCRGEEIYRWLMDNKDVTHYVIIDDDLDMLLFQRDHFVKSCPSKGISKANVKKAIRILSNQQI